LPQIPDEAGHPLMNATVAIDHRESVHLLAAFGDNLRHHRRLHAESACVDDEPRVGDRRRAARRSWPGRRRSRGKRRSGRRCDGRWWSRPWRHRWDHELGELTGRWNGDGYLDRATTEVAHVHDLSATNDTRHA